MPTRKSVFDLFLTHLYFVSSISLSLRTGFPLVGASKVLIFLNIVIVEQRTSAKHVNISTRKIFSTWEFWRSQEEDDKSRRSPCSVPSYHHDTEYPVSFLGLQNLSSLFFDFELLLREILLIN